MHLHRNKEPLKKLGSAGLFTVISNDQPRKLRRTQSAPEDALRPTIFEFFWLRVDPESPIPLN